jgi:hypothetical protein
MSCHYTLLQHAGALACCPSKSSPDKALDPEKIDGFCREEKVV